MYGKDYWFISHSTQNKQTVDAVVELLNICGIPYWKAPEMIPRGSCYAKEIPKAIRSCAVFLLVLSEEAQESVYVQREVDLAISDRKKLLTLKIDRAVLNDMFHFWLNTVQMQEVIVQRDGSLSWEMKESLKNLFLQQAGKHVEPLKKSSAAAAPKSFAKVDTRSNAFRVNKIPLQCEECGELLEKNGFMGVYTCPRCGREYYDDFRKIRNFLEYNGSATAWEISKNTGVSTSAIKAYFADEAEQTNSLNQRQLADRKDLWHFRRG